MRSYHESKDTHMTYDVECLREAITRLEIEAYQHGYTRPDPPGRMRPPANLNRPSTGDKHHAARNEVNRLLDDLAMAEEGA